MSKLGKSFKNKFLRRALAMLLAGTMVLSGMPVSFAAEQPDAGSTVETELQGRTENVSEEAAEVDEVAQKESEETEAGEESRKPSEESETISKEGTTVQSDKESENAETETYEITSVIETEESETNTEETETEQTTEEEENEATIADAVLASGHMKASWGVDGTVKSDDSSQTGLIQKTVGTYTNADKDVLFIDASASKAKFEYNTDSKNNGRFQVNPGTKIYVPVIGNKAKITIKLSYADTVDNLFSDYLSVTGISGNDIPKNCTKVGKDYGNTVIECELDYGQDEAGAVCLEIIQAGSNTKDKNYIQGITVVCGDAASDVHESTEGDDEKYIKYNQEGYASSYGTNGVTGGGLLKKGVSENYYEVNTADAFLKALEKIKSSGEKSVIEITADMKLGNNEITVSDYKSGIIKANAETPLCHPTLIKTGVSDLNLDGFSDLTIFSSNGSSILHTNIILKRSSNIIFRNIKFDELWEWDEGGTNTKGETCKPGDYDRNDWDYLCIDQDCDGIWIDHCTFYKAYDGIVDVKNPADKGKERVTISWCEFLPASELVDGKPKFFDEQMTDLESHISDNSYYNQLRTSEGFSAGQVRMYAYGQKKTHLFGQGDDAKNAVGIRVTLANNNYNNSMDRMPRLRYGKVHEYNCILDAHEIYTAKKEMNGTSHIVSNGASSTCGGEILLENCYIRDIKNALNSGNGDSPLGRINAINSTYILDGAEKTLKPENNTSNAADKDKDALITDADAFKTALPYYGYATYDATALDTNVKPYAGAGKLELSEVQWEKVSYGTRDGYGTREEGDSGSGEEGGENPPSETDPDDKPEKKALDAKEVYEDTATEPATDVHTIDKEYTSKDGFIIKANAGNTVTVEANSKPPYTHRIKLGGAADSGYRSIHFTTTGPGTLTVYAISSSNTATTGDRVLELYKGKDSKDHLITSKDIKAGSELIELSYDIDGKGDYWIGSKSGGINIYHIDLEYTPEEGGDNPPTPPAIEYPEDSLILDANKLPDITIETEQKINSQYTIIGTSDAAVTIGNINEDGSAITIKEKEFSKQIQLGGAGDPTKRTIKITVTEAGKLAVYAQTKGTENGTLVLKGDLETSQEAANTVTASEPAVIEYTVSEAGTYYLYSTDSNINIFYAEYTAGPADEGEKTDTFYDASEGNSAELTKYNLEGFAASARVTGGGLLKEGSKNYYVVTNEQEFIDALNSVRSLGTEGGLKPAEEIKPAVIEIQKDLNLGYLELKNQGIDIDQKPAKTVIEKHRKQPLIHPTLKETGVSKIKLNYFHNLTIYSKNGNSIKHCGISFEGATSNIIIRNITFDEFWEWDEKTSGNYDENDWDYMTVDEQTDGLWVDHCTFYKAYDGIIDVRGDNKNQIDRQRVTISWCEFLPGSKSNTFFDAQMDYLETNKSRTTYYKRLRDTENMSEEDVWWYAYGQKKTHLFGAEDSMEYASMIRVTMANNYYKNSMDRMPRLRYGKVHEYNCILDAQDLYDRRETAKHITSNGAISTCGGEVLLENCQIKGIENPLLSGNGSSPTGYINAVNSLYYLNGVETELKPAQKGTGALLITDVEKFKNAIPYKNYVVYDASTLESTVMPGAGAGKINMSTVQWEKVSYGARSTDVTEDYTEGVYGGDAPDKPTAVPGSESQATAVAAGTKIELNAEGADNIYYTTGTTPEDTADPKNSQSGRQKYDAETGIVITEAVTIKAVAEKGNRYSEVAAYTYTIAGGDTPVTPPGPDDPDNPDNPVEVKTISLDDCVITVPAAIYNNKTGNKQSTAYVVYQYTDANGNQNHVRFVEGVDYEAEWKKDGNNYSVILTGSGRSADGRDVDTYIIDEKSSKEIPYKVYATAKDANLINISKAKVDFKAAKKTALKNVYYTGYAYEIEVGDLDFSKDKSGLKDVPQEYLRVACSNNINAGKAAVTISVDPAYSDGKYAGVKTLSFTIKKAALNKNANKATAAVSFDKTASAAQPYMGTAVEAKDLQVAAKNGVKLRKNEDYTVTYKNGVKNGKVNVTVTVKGVGNNLSGTWSDTFAISQLDLGSQSVEINTKNSAIPYSPKGAKLGTITITKDGSTCTLKEGVDYNAKYEYDPAKKYNVGGKATAVITGKGACKGTRRIANLEIIAADFNSDEHIIVSGDVTVDKDAYNKNKTKAIEKAVTVTDASGVKLKAGKDFKIEEHADTKTLVIQPAGSNAQNYTGTKTVPYRIATNLAKDKSFVFDKTKEKNDPLVYDGRNPVKLTTKDIDKYINKMSSDAENYDQRKYRLGGSNANIEIVPGTYKNNAKKGTAQVTVRGVAGVDDGFYGTKVLKFKIVEQ